MQSNVKNDHFQRTSMDSSCVFLQVMDIYLYIDVFFLEYERANFICVPVKYGFNQRGLWRNGHKQYLRASLTLKDKPTHLISIKTQILTSLSQITASVLNAV